MKKVLFPLLAVLAVSACGKSDDLMKCGAYEVTVALNGEELTAVLNGDEVVLKQAVAASGVRYVGELNDTEVVLWNKGDDWTLYLADEDPIECK